MPLALPAQGSTFQKVGHNQIVNHDLRPGLDHGAKDERPVKVSRITNEVPIYTF